MILPISLLLQKHSKTQRLKTNFKALERRPQLWTEDQAIHSSLKPANAYKTIVRLSKKFVEQMQKGNVN